MKSDDDTELFKNIVLTYVDSESISAQNLINQLEGKSHGFSDCLISYFSEKEQLFVFLGRHPIKEESIIPIKELIR